MNRAEGVMFVLGHSEPHPQRGLYPGVESTPPAQGEEAGGTRGH